MIRSLVIATGLTALSLGTALACGFHNYAPKQSVVDQMLSTDRMVLARQSSSNPFGFEVVSELKGEAGPITLPQLVDTVTRRKLALSPTDAVLFLRDVETGEWKRIAYVDHAMQPVLDAILQRLDGWRLGGDMERYQLFADMMNHPDNQVRALALRELDQADYSVLASLALSPDVDRLTARLAEMQETDLEPIRVLLLGFSPTPAAREVLRDGLQRNLSITSKALGAYVTAYIEQYGEEAISTLVRDHLGNADIPVGNRELLIEALAIHKQSGDPALGHIILSALEDAIDANPELAPMAARQFGARHEWALRHALAKAAHSSVLFNEQDQLDLADYIAFAGQSGDPLQQ